MLSPPCCHSLEQRIPQKLTTVRQAQALVSASQAPATHAKATQATHAQLTTAVTTITRLTTDRPTTVPATADTQITADPFTHDLDSASALAAVTDRLRTVIVTTTTITTVATTAARTTATKPHAWI